MGRKRMDNAQYQELDKLISEYEEDFRNIRSERLMMKNYPKVLTMSAASSFENYIKQRCQDFLLSPILPLSSYPKIDSMRGNKPKEDQMFSKLKVNGPNGIELLSAEEFYELFGGQAFKSAVKANFFSEQARKIGQLESTIEVLSALLGKDEKYDFEYAKLCDLKEMLENSSFDDAEKAYLSLKRRRNSVAHNYIHGLSDTFEDIRNFYNLAVIYVVSLETAIVSLTNT